MAEQKAKSMSFKEKVPFEERLKDSKAKLAVNPNLIPVIIEKHDQNTRLSDLDKVKYLVEGDMKLQDLQKNIRKKLQLKKEESLFFFTARKRIDRPDTFMKEIYAKSKDEDGFLYITYSEIVAFGF